MKTSLGKKIIIIGSPGSGKTTFSKELSKRIGIPLYHLDDLYWHEDWNPTPEDEWIETIKELVKTEEYIIDGNYADTLEIRLEFSDTVIFLDTSLFLCLIRILKRTVNNKLKRNVILPKRIREASYYREQKASEGLFAFLIFVIKFHLFTKPRIYRLINDYSNFKEIIIVKNKRQINDILSR